MDYPSTKNYVGPNNSYTLDPLPLSQSLAYVASTNQCQMQAM